MEIGLQQTNCQLTVMLAVSLPQSVDLVRHFNHLIKFRWRTQTSNHEKTNSNNQHLQVLACGREVPIKKAVIDGIFYEGKLTIVSSICERKQSLKHA